MKIALVTSCIAGVAQSKMAAKILTIEAESRGFEICVEEQGGHKIPNKLTKEDIDSSDVVIFAKAVAISGKDRFQGKPIFQTTVGKAIRKSKSIIDDAVATFENSQS